jgi:8-oxo-dGTP diphosphatase
LSRSYPIHVVVAVIVNSSNEVLISYRMAEAHQGNKWEFPGGKVEENEGIAEALRREIREELGLEILKSEPFIGINHYYCDKWVFLDVWKVTDYRGNAEGREGQAIEWQPISKLKAGDFPAANIEIIEKLQSM